MRRKLMVCWMNFAENQARKAGYHQVSTSAYSMT
jgi:hypothetical protein